MRAPSPAPIILDVSRLLSRASRRVPTGIDRVEHAYATGLHQAAPDRLRYAAVHPLGRFSHLPTSRAREFVDRIGDEWLHAMPTGDHGGGAKLLARRLQTGLMLPQTGARFLHRLDGRPTYLLVSHHHLHQPELIESARRRFGHAGAGARFVCFVHDLIPIDFPEFGRPHEAAKHRRRIETAARYADALIVNSAATRDSLLPFLAQAGRDIPLLIAPLGVGAPAPTPSPPSHQNRPYFLYIGTIEPRKNHLLLFHIWRRLALEMGEATPRLILIGQRGWENEMVIDVLERSEILRDHIIEHNALPDETVRSLTAGAQAVLLPSFAEGYGLPIAEALAAGTPVLCSDLPAFHEVGGQAPEYLDPLDGLGWARAIRDYTASPSPRRSEALDRITTWSPPGWRSHVDAVLHMIDGLDA